MTHEQQGADEREKGGIGMTRDEAALVIKDRLNDEIWKQENGLEVFPVNMDAFRVAIKALRGPVPDPDTGLVPCGCGGKARVQHNPRRKMPYRVACPLCFMQADTAKTEDDAKFFWNHGHGYVPGREGTV